MVKAATNAIGMMRIIAATSCAAALTVPAAAMAADAEAGQAFVEGHCARCHATGSTGGSPMEEAPAFRTLFDNYAPEDLEEALAEGIVTGHPAMPEWQLEPQEVADVIAYLNKLIGR